jgi:hypothetical protein
MSSRCAKRPASRITAKRRGAFVLVMVLALLTVCALCLAGLARRSLEASEQAASAQTDLQRRWGIVSCERTYLPLAKDVLEAEAAKLPAQGQVWPLPASVSAQFDFGELHFSVLLADEDAKANLNAISRSNPDGIGTVASLLESMMAGAEGLAVNIQPLPTQNSANQAANGSSRSTNAFRSWGQIFESPNGGCPGDFAARLRDATRDITCWGSGRVNIARASDEAIRLVCGNQITPDILAKLLAHRHEPGITGLEPLLDGLALRTTDRSTLERLLTIAARAIRSGFSSKAQGEVGRRSPSATGAHPRVRAKTSPGNPVLPCDSKPPNGS